MYQAHARWCYHHRWTVVGVWIALIVGLNAVGGVVGSAFDAEFTSTGSESNAGFETLEEYFPGAGSAFGGQIVFRSAEGVDDPDVAAAMTEMFDEVATIEGVTIVSPYTPFGAEQVNDDGTIAFAQVNLANDINESESVVIGEQITEATPTLDGLRVEIGGAALGEFEPPESELIGLAFAIVVLVLAFGSVLAMGLPIGVAIAGVGAGGFGLVSLLTHAFQIPEFAPLIGIMIGLGVGIDYALFIITRYRELTRAGATPEQATIGAMDTAGRAVVFAGITVVLSLLGMLLIGLPFIAGLGIAAAATVAVTLLASITLLPALLALAHDRLEVTRWRGLIMAGFAAIALLGLGLSLPVLALFGAVLFVGTLLASFGFAPLRRVVPPRPQKPIRETWAYRWSHLIQARPWTFLIAGTAVLLILGAPLLGLRLGFSDEGNFPEETTTRQAYDLIGEGFGPGFNGPFLLAAQIDSADDIPTIEQLAAAGVQSVSQPFPNDLDDPAASEAFIVRIVPTTSPQDEVTEQTVLRLRSDVIAPIVDGTGIEANLTGAVPANIDFSDYLGGRILIFFGAVLAVSFVLLMMVFRSLLVPLKAVLMFGLSMDYEVFLLSRVKEEYDRTGDAKNSVADGLAATARVITAAAAIMVVVFGAFLLEDNRIIKLFGTGLALAIFLDATLVRMLLVPATMELLGSRNWWFPKWLDRLVPTLNVEGHELEQMHAGFGVAVVDESGTEPDTERIPVDA